MSLHSLSAQSRLWKLEIGAILRIARLAKHLSEASVHARRSIWVEGASGNSWGLAVSDYDIGAANLKTIPNGAPGHP